MKIVKHFILALLGAINGVIGIGLLACAYSPYLSPVAHPVWACAGLFFPIFMCLNAACCIVWLCVKPWGLWIPLLFFALGWNSLHTYFPIGSVKEAEPGSKTLKLLTYNTQGIAANSPKQEEGQNPVLAYLRDSGADIICLQEFRTGAGASKRAVEEAMKAYPYRQTTCTSGGDVLACYSRYPILSATPINYSSQFNGSVLYRLEIEGDTLTLVNNHLESNKLDSYDKKAYNELLKSPNEANMKNEGKHLLRKLAEAVAIRAPQADSVAQAIRRNSSRYVLVCGDFNDSPVSYAHRVIGEGLNDAFVEAGAGPGFTYNQNHLYFRIDHIFASPAFRVLECKVDRSIRASDHYPVWCIVAH